MMRQARRVGGLLLIAAVCLASAAAPGAPGADSKGDKVPVDPIKYDNLGKLVRSLRGKVVLVNFWASY